MHSIPDAFLTTPRAKLLVKHLDLEMATGVEDARWEHFQIDHLNDDSKFRIARKSRQVAFSWTLAAEAVADAILATQSSAFVSINEEEAKEKVRYAGQIYRSLKGLRFYLPRILRENQTTLEFDNGARILSLPAKPIRGKPRFNVGLDEFAHAPKDKDIYVGSLPVITKGGRVRVGSSTMGASGVFWEIFSEALQKYPRYVRKTIPWWHVHALCTDVLSALDDAHLMTTRERVGEYGNETIQALYESMAEEDFQQEFECLFVDDSAAWITWPEIRMAQMPGLRCVVVEARGVDYTTPRLAINQVAGMIRRGEIEDVLFAGLDIGRTRNASELFVVGIGKTGHAVLRLAITMQSMPFPEQRDIATRAVRQLGITTLLIDRNGIGRQIAEELEQALPGRAAGVDFTNASKVEWATALKIAFQKARLTLPVDRDIAYQVHSVKRKVTASRNLVFDTDSSEKHHADKFWALALAVSATPEPDTYAHGGQFSYLDDESVPERDAYQELGR